MGFAGSGDGEVVGLWLIVWLQVAAHGGLGRCGLVIPAWKWAEEGGCLFGWLDFDCGELFWVW